MSGQIKTQQTQRHQDVDGDVRSADVQKDDGFLDLEDPLGETMVDPMLAEAETDTAERSPPSEEALGLLDTLWAAMEEEDEGLEESGDGATEAVDAGVAAASASPPPEDAGNSEGSLPPGEEDLVAEVGEPVVIDPEQIEAAADSEAPAEVGVSAETEMVAPEPMLSALSTVASVSVTEPKRYAIEG